MLRTYAADIAVDADVDVNVDCAVLLRYAPTWKVQSKKKKKKKTLSQVEPFENLTKTKQTRKA